MCGSRSDRLSEKRRQQQHGSSVDARSMTIPDRAQVQDLAFDEFDAIFLTCFVRENSDLNHPVALLNGEESSISFDLHVAATKDIPSFADLPTIALPLPAFSSLLLREFTAQDLSQERLFHFRRTIRSRTKERLFATDLFNLSLQIFNTGLNVVSHADANARDGPSWEQ